MLIGPNGTKRDLSLKGVSPLGKILELELFYDANYCILAISAYKSCRI